MSVFGEQLKALIDANEVNIYGLAKTAGLERTAIHKIISGDRIPSDEYVYKLADALPLSPEERRHLLESFNISKIGEFKYRQRIQVKDLIESIAHIENRASRPVTAGVVLPVQLSEMNTTATGHFAVNSLVNSVITEVIANVGTQGVDFIIPESYQYFYNELLVFYLNHPKLQIRHIIPFSKKTDSFYGYNRNLTLLSHVLPFAFAPGTGYAPFYFYRTAYEVDPTQVMPYFILTSRNRLVLLNRDFNKAALICDDDIIALYKESFSSMLEQSKLLIKRLNSASDFFEHNKGISTDADSLFYWIEPEPCITSLASDELINEYLKIDIPDREKVAKTLSIHCRFFRENYFHTINICTTDGLYRAINTGCFYSVPTELINPLNHEALKSLLIMYKNRIEAGETKILFANPSKMNIPNNIFLSVSRRTGVNFVMHNSAVLDGRVIYLSEDSINEAFVDFVESMEDSELVYNEQVSLATLNNIINEL